MQYGSGIAVYGTQSAPGQAFTFRQLDGAVATVGPQDTLIIYHTFVAANSGISVTPLVTITIPATNDDIPMGLPCSLGFTPVLVSGGPAQLYCHLIRP